MVRGLFDTCILIDYLNGVDEAKLELDLYEDKAISVITWMEVMVGVKNDQEVKTRVWLENTFSIIGVSNEISHHAVIILESSVESQTSAQSLVAPRKLKNPQLTNKVKLEFLSSLGTPMAYTSYLRSTDDSRTIRKKTKIKLPDAIIYSTAKSTHRLFVTRNTKDFPQTDPAVRVPYEIK